jgi:hypothetical protein
MIGKFEGALSSRPKRAIFILPQKSSSCQHFKKLFLRFFNRPEALPVHF